MANVFTSIGTWITDRAPGMMPMYRKHMTEYYAPKNFNFWYYFGSLALLVLVNQILTGIFLTMFYKPGAATAFDSVEYIMRDVQWGWLIRYMHSTGASMFFIVVYLHMFRGLMYGSFKKPRELVWLMGMLIFLALMAEAFMGYVLPWGNMSFWGAKVIISLFGAVPLIGDALVQWIMGDFNPADATLNRFFALHVIALPLVLLLLVVLHIAALHEVGSNNPDGVEIKKVRRTRTAIRLDGIRFHPYYTVKDLFGVGFFLIICAFIIFFQPTLGGWFLENDNFIPANNLVTPAEIKPVWYFTPFYAILRVIPSKGLGVLAMFAVDRRAVPGAVARSRRGEIDPLPRSRLQDRARHFRASRSSCSVRSARARSTEWIPDIFGAECRRLDVHRECFRPVADLVCYFGFFVFLWVYTILGLRKPKPVPERVTTHA